MIDIDDLEARLKKAKNRAERAKNVLDSASSEVSRLETALSVFREISGSLTPSTSPSSNLTQKQKIVINSLKYGQSRAMSPVDVYQLASSDNAFDGDVNYVRTTLWRMADKGSIGGANGTYWKYLDSAEVAVLDPSLPSGGHGNNNSEAADFGSWDADDLEAPF